MASPMKSNRFTFSPSAGSLLAPPCERHLMNSYVLEVFPRGTGSFSAIAFLETDEDGNPTRCHFSSPHPLRRSQRRAMQNLSDEITQAIGDDFVQRLAGADVVLIAA
jgi:hypothetical protein